MLTAEKVLSSVTAQRGATWGAGITQGLCHYKEEPSGDRQHTPASAGQRTATVPNTWHCAAPCTHSAESSVTHSTWRLASCLDTCQEQQEACAVARAGLATEMVDCSRLRSLVQDCLDKHLSTSAVFYADKLVTLSGYAPGDVYLLAQVDRPIRAPA
jgi:hypothetical protein